MMYSTEASYTWSPLTGQVLHLAEYTEACLAEAPSHTLQQYKWHTEFMQKEWKQWSKESASGRC
jgi:uncharacterized protein (DUF2344 family)